MLTGQTANSTKRREVYRTKRIIFATPQVIDADFKSDALKPHDIVCLVVDEAHRATGNFAYVNVARGAPPG